MHLDKFLRESFTKIDLLVQSNEFENGHNGPYRDEETDVRKLAHLLVLYSNIIKSNLLPERNDLIPRLKLILDQLLNNENYKSGAYFRCRLKPGKDEVNGVIGVAWVIEGLCAAYEVLEDQNILIFLEEIINAIKFNQQRNLWERPTYINTNKSGIDETFNHQLWIAYALIYYSKVTNKEILLDVKSFFSNLDKHLTIHQDGLIKHALENKYGNKNRLKSYLKKWKISLESKLKGKTTRYKENGYHLFNMFAFARIYYLGFDSLFVNSINFQKALNYVSSKKLLKELSSNKENTDYYPISTPSLLKYNRYGFPYNVAGFEFIYVDKVFKLKLEHLSGQYLSNQIQVCGYNIEFNKFKENMQSEDELNLLLRSYELSYYLI